MKKIITLVLVVFVIVGMVSCKTAPQENPGIKPVLTVTIPEEFSPNPDKSSDKLVVGIDVQHPVPIKDWKISITLQRQQGQSGGDAAPERQRRAFYEAEGQKKPPTKWQWDGVGTRGNMVTSLQTYRFQLTVTDIFENVGTYEGLINVGVIVVKDGKNYRIVVPAIVFPPNDSDLSKVSEDDQRSNRRVLRLVARILNQYESYAITVEGHANPTTAPKTPERKIEEDGTDTIIGLVPLSQDRAQAVADYLATRVEGGDNVKQDRLRVVGIGGERTVADYDDVDENWRNRRVEFILHK